MNRLWTSVALYSLAVIIAFFVYLYLHLGLQKPVSIEVVDRESIWLVYKNHLGAYHEIGPVIREVEVWAATHNIPCPKTFGEYVDDPAGVDQDRLRSHGGCIIPSRVAVDLPDGFEQRELPAGRFIAAHFGGSPAAGPLKVYPAVHKYAEEHRLPLAGPVFELYLVNGDSMTTEYLFSLP